MPKRLEVSRGFARQLANLKQDGKLAMNEVSKLRKTAIREIDKSADRVAATKAYDAAFGRLSTPPKDKRAGNFLGVVRTEFAQRVKGELLAAKLRAFFGAHSGRLPAKLKAVVDVGRADAFRVSATGGQGTGRRELNLDVPLKPRGQYEGMANDFYAFLKRQPELKSVTRELKPSEWGGLDLWVRSSLDVNALGWSTEDALHGFEQAQHTSSLGGKQVAQRELGDIIQALANIGTLHWNRRDNSEWLQAKKDLVTGFKKAEAAGHVSPKTREAFLELATLYGLDVSSL